MNVNEHGGLLYGKYREITLFKETIRIDNMKRNNFLFCLLISGYLLFLHCGCREQEKAQGQLKSLPNLPGSSQPASTIKFDNLVVDLGKVGPGSKTTNEAKFTNTGNDILKITDVIQCCGVTTLLEKKEYAPGEKGVLTVAYHATTDIGPFKGHVIVCTNNRADPNTTLTIKAEVVPKIAFTPDRLKLFLGEENAACPKLTIKSLDNRPFAIMGIRSTADCITADYDPSAEATEFVLDLKVDTEKLQKNRRGNIDFVFTHPEGKTGRLIFNVLPKYSLDPGMLLCYGAKENVPITKTVKVLTNYNKDFEIESTASEDNLIHVTGSSKIENGYSLGLEITPPAKEGKIGFSDILYINLKGGEKLTVNCTAYYE
jgi:hypothetical protein